MLRYLKAVQQMKQILEDNDLVRARTVYLPTSHGIYARYGLPLTYLYSM